jgi:dephospho-CoA kinase
MTRPYCVGLTGGIGSGKNLASCCFADLGVDVIDSDVIAHELTGPKGAAMAAVVDAFGTAMQCADGSLDRVKMRDLVFSTPGARNQLEAILHPLILDVARRKLEASTSSYAILVVPLLVESEAFASLVDRILVVDCPEVQQIARVMVRDGVSEASVQSIMASQVSRAQRLAAADDILENWGEMDLLRRQVAELHRKYLELASNAQG